MKKLLIIISLLVLSGCKTIDSRGQFIDNAQIQALENKNLTKDQVIEMLGYPTMTPDYSANTWYYASLSLARKTWTMPKVRSERVVKLTFVGDMLSEVDVLNESKGSGIKVLEEYTKSKGTEMNSLQRFVRNFGRFNKASSKKKHR